MPSRPNHPFLRSSALALLLCLAGPLLLAGCDTKTSDRDLEIVSPEVAQEKMLKKSGPFGAGGTVNGIYLDPRDQAAFWKRHIKGAVNVPFKDIETRWRALEGYDVIVVYDTDYSDIIAKAASKRLIELGHKNVLTLRGGLKAWEQDGLPTGSGAGAPLEPAS